eukprot:2811532-Prymnesium_polylepis.1
MCIRDSPESAWPPVRHTQLVSRGRLGLTLLLTLLLRNVGGTLLVVRRTDTALCCLRTTNSGSIKWYCYWVRHYRGRRVKPTTWPDEAFASVNVVVEAFASAAAYSSDWHPRVSHNRDWPVSQPCRAGNGNQEAVLAWAMRDRDGAVAQRTQDVPDE